MSMSAMVTVVGRLVSRDDGQDLLEYGLLAVLIAIVAFVSVSYLGTTIHTVFWQGIVQNF